MKKKHKLSMAFGTIAALAVIIMILVIKPNETSFAKEDEVNLTEGRYVRNTDGIWRLSDDVLKDFFKNVKRDIKYSAYTVSMNNVSIEFNRIGRDLSKLLGRVDATMEKELECKAVCMFVGDLMCLKGQQYAAEVKGGYDFWPSYSYVAKQFKTADFVCGNLETLLSESNPITKIQVNAANGQPQCNGPKVYLDALRRAGIDMVVTANNHTCD